MRLFTASILAVIAAALLAGSAFAATPSPVITSFSPAQVRVGQPLVINGKNFRKGAKVYFTRTSDGKTVVAKATKVTSKRIEVVVPPDVDKFLTLDAAQQKQPTRFKIRIFSKTFSKYTKAAKSPLIAPAGANTPGGGTVGTGTTPTSDCDADGIPDTAETDDDNDLLSDDTEKGLGLDPCKKDTDGDNVEDGYEYYSAVDLNGSGRPYPAKRPYPNALDPADAVRDFDGDGLTLSEEFAAWAKFGGHSLPLSYSDGTQYTGGAAAPAAGREWMDMDNNGKVSDEEKDVDGDGLPNFVELAKKENSPASNNRPGCGFGNSTGNPDWAQPNIFTDCGAGYVPNGNTFVPLDQLAFQQFRPDYLDPDTDGDGVNDSLDDQDHDLYSNLEEITAGGDGIYTGPQEPCDPNPESPGCERHSRGTGA
jgi:hypothetical protein